MSTRGSKMPTHFVWVTAKVVSRSRRELRLSVVDRDMRERPATLYANLLQGERELPSQPGHREFLVPARWAHQYKLETGPVEITASRLGSLDYSSLEARVLALQASGQAPKGFALPALPTGTATGRQQSWPEYQAWPGKK